MSEALEAAKDWRNIAITLQQLKNYLDEIGCIDSFASDVEALRLEAEEHIASLMAEAHEEGEVPR
jgi:hypothetical protein